MEKKKGTFKKIRRGAGFILIPAINYKSIVNVWKSLIYFYRESRNKYEENKNIDINDIDEKEKLSFSKKDIGKVKTLNIIAIFVMLVYLISILLNTDSNIFSNILSYLPLFMILSTLSFSLSYLKFIMINNKRVKLKAFIKEVKSNIFLLIP
ncbi:hypothetical protein [Zymobacter sp. IVIA_12111.31 C1]|uniref:hypothetical protein n=1 Tax=Zymobacter sp. IVIA_12111.31 C1 TaxID=3394854 RepID=UPI0039C2689C